MKRRGLIAVWAGVFVGACLAQDAKVTIPVDSPAKGYWGGLHPNPRAHATFSAQIIAQVMTALK